MYNKKEELLRVLKKGPFRYYKVLVRHPIVTEVEYLVETDSNEIDHNGLNKLPVYPGDIIDIDDIPDDWEAVQDYKDWQSEATVSRIDEVDKNGKVLNGQQD